MKSTALPIFKIFIAFLVISLAYFIIPSGKAYAQTNTNFWQYQCIDTMKISRDNARGWAANPDLEAHIQWEMQTIKSLGANCVAIGTPYDAEFLPYLSKWVAGARAEGLHIWFRGNFSGWEGWFDYPKITDTTTYLQNLATFITTNPQLFADGDIFTGTPEAENGGPFAPMDATKFVAYRQFLTDEYAKEQHAFTNINKQVQVNWFSMNGDIARNMFDQPTLNNIGNLTTIDHYVSTPDVMTAYLDYLTTTFNTKVMLGEFGAPIPDLNGPMTEDEQATFVNSVFRQLYLHRNVLIGINYWDLYGGSTALANDDQTLRKVTDVIKKYFIPPVITGHVTDEKGTALANVSVTTDDKQITILTDQTGRYSFPVATDSVMLTFTKDKTATSASVSNLKPGDVITQNIIIKSNGCLQKVEKFFKGLLK